MKVENFLLEEKRIKIKGLRFFLPRKEVVLIFPGFFQSKDTRIFRLLQKKLSIFFDIICIDMPGHGRSGSFFTFGSNNENKAFYLTLDYAKRFYSRIGFLAFSLSAMVAVNCLSKTHSDSLALVSCPYDFSKIEFHFLSWRAVLLGLRSLDWHSGCLAGFPLFPKDKPIENIKHIKVPILFLHGEKDPIISKEHSIVLAKTHRGENRIYIFKEGNHAEDLFRIYPDIFLSEIIAWFKKTLDINHE